MCFKVKKESENGMWIAPDELRRLGHGRKCVGVSKIYDDRSFRPHRLVEDSNQQRIVVTPCWARAGGGGPLVEKMALYQLPVKEARESKALNIYVTIQCKSYQYRGARGVVEVPVV